MNKYNLMLYSFGSHWSLIEGYVAHASNDMYYSSHILSSALTSAKTASWLDVYEFANLCIPRVRSSDIAGQS